jgi:hypothetical protein
MTVLRGGMIKILITVLSIQFLYIPILYCDTGQVYIFSSLIFITEQTPVLSVHIYGNFHISSTKLNDNFINLHNCPYYTKENLSCHPETTAHAFFLISALQRKRSHIKVTQQLAQQTDLTQ